MSDPGTPSTPSRLADAPSGAVLVGVDGSSTSLSALRWAHWFATTTERPLRVAHAWERGRGPDLQLSAVPSSVETLEAAIEVRLRELVTDTIPGRPEVPCRTLRGEVGSALTREATRTDAALLVVGRRGSGGVRDALIGSTSRHLTECPVQAVAVLPEEVGDLAPGRWSALVGVDGSAGSARAVRWTAEAAARAGGEVVAVHAFEAPTADLRAAEVESLVAESKQRLDEEWTAPLRSAHVAYRTMVVDGDPRRGLERAAEEVDPAFLVLGARGLGPISQRLLGSVTHHLVQRLERPVIVIPSPRDRPMWPAAAERSPTG